MTTLLNIGATAATGDCAKMIRHYEPMGLLCEAKHSEASHCLYGREVSVRRFVRQSRHLGFSAAHIAELIGLLSDSRRTRRKVKAVACMRAVQVHHEAH